MVNYKSAHTISSGMVLIISMPFLLSSGAECPSSLKYMLDETAIKWFIRLKVKNVAIHRKVAKRVGADNLLICDSNVCIDLLNSTIHCGAMRMRW